MSASSPTPRPHGVSVSPSGSMTTQPSSWASIRQSASPSRATVTTANPSPAARRRRVERLHTGVVGDEHHRRFPRLTADASGAQVERRRAACRRRRRAERGSSQLQGGVQAGCFVERRRRRHEPIGRHPDEHDLRRTGQRGECHRGGQAADDVGCQRLGKVDEQQADGFEIDEQLTGRRGADVGERRARGHRAAGIGGEILQIEPGGEHPRARRRRRAATGRCPAGRAHRSSSAARRSVWPRRPPAGALDRRGPGRRRAAPRRAGRSAPAGPAIAWSAPLRRPTRTEQRDAGRPLRRATAGAVGPRSTPPRRRQRGRSRRGRSPPGSSRTPRLLHLQRPWVARRPSVPPLAPTAAARERGRATWWRPARTPEVRGRPRSAARCRRRPQRSAQRAAPARAAVPGPRRDREGPRSRRG